jgi:hypothetical protein
MKCDSIMGDPGDTRAENRYDSKLTTGTGGTRLAGHEGRLGDEGLVDVRDHTTAAVE